MNLKPPFDSFRMEKRAGEYKDFQLAPGDTYPLKGVTYPVDYGDIDGYLVEDGVNLDVFVGTKANGLLGFIKVWREDTPNGETKVFINVDEAEEQAILEAFKPVLVENGRFESYDELLDAIQQFKTGSNQAP